MSTETTNLNNGHASTQNKNQFLTQIDITGPDSAKFLQGQLSVNVTQLPPLEACLACVCNHKGRIVSLFHIYPIENGFRLLLPAELIESTITHLKKYGVFFKTDIVPSISQFSIVRSQNANNEASSKPSTQGIQIQNMPLTLVFEQNQHALTRQAWLKTLFDSSIPWLTIHSIEAFLPHNLNLPALKAVDFNKGCFTGQEVIARMQYKGKLKQQMVKLRASEVLNIQSQDKLFQESKSVAEVICAVSDESFGTGVIALVKDKANKSESFLLKSENGPILEVIP